MVDLPPISKLGTLRALCPIYLQNNNKRSSHAHTSMTHTGGVSILVTANFNLLILSSFQVEGLGESRPVLKSNQKHHSPITRRSLKWAIISLEYKLFMNHTTYGFLPPLEPAIPRLTLIAY